MTKSPSSVAEIAGEPAKKTAPRPGIVGLYNKLEIGMNRRQVEAIVGKPVLEPVKGRGDDLRVYYLGVEYAERPLLPHESPRSPAGIFVIYRDETLVEKTYNSQWVMQ